MIEGCMGAGELSACLNQERQSEVYDQDSESFIPRTRTRSAMTVYVADGKDRHKTLAAMSVLVEDGIDGIEREGCGDHRLDDITSARSLKMERGDPSAGEGWLGGSSLRQERLRAERRGGRDFEEDRSFSLPIRHALFDRRCRAGLCAFAGLSVCLCLVILAARRAAAKFDAGSAEAPSFSIDERTEVSKLSESAGRELHTDVDIKYTDLAGIGHIDNIGSAEQCCATCKSEPECQAYTWVKDAHLLSATPGQCWLKGGRFVSASVKRGVSSAFVRDDNPDALTEARRLARKAVTAWVPREVVPETTTTATTTAGTTTTAGVPTTTTEDPLAQCASRGASCMKEKCCHDPGFQCMTKNPFWAQCMDTCTPGPNPSDQVNDEPWECKTIGPRTPGKAAGCASDGDNCFEHKCCRTAGHQCFGKNETWGTCKASCDPYSGWSCNKVGFEAPSRAPWVPKKCAKEGDDCSISGCCAQTGRQCYRQTSFWAGCRRTCEAGSLATAIPGETRWSCEKLGLRTPEVAVSEQEAAVSAEEIPLSVQP